MGYVPIHQPSAALSNCAQHHPTPRQSPPTHFCRLQPFLPSYLGLVQEQYFNWLKSTQQEEKAAELRERERRYEEAINLYLEGGLPARAAHVVNTHGMTTQPQLLEAIASALLKAGMYEKV